MFTLKLQNHESSGLGVKANFLNHHGFGFCFHLFLLLLLFLVQKFGVINDLTKPADLLRVKFQRDPDLVLLPIF